MNHGSYCICNGFKININIVFFFYNDNLKVLNSKGDQVTIHLKGIQGLLKNYASWGSRIRNKIS